MSFMDNLASFAWGPGMSYGQAMGMGSNYTWGGDLEETIVGGAKTRVRTPTGAHIDYFHTPGTPSSYTPKPGAARLTPGGAIGIGTSLLFNAPAFWHGGIAGGAHALVQDASIGAALGRWGHQMRSYNGSTALTYGNLGKIAKPIYEALSKGGWAGRRGANLMGFGSYMSRMGGSIAGTMVSDAVFGTGIVGNAVTPYAAGMGARYSPYLLAGAVVAGGAYLAGKTGYRILRAGYDYRQQHKSIQTSGDLMAFNTGAALTMRARAVQAMQNSHMNARSALGQEAQFMHAPQRNYHSPYRAGF